MAHYFASDIHLRADRPERDRRFCNWLERLDPDDQLVIGGDLCDFWMGARRADNELLDSDSLRALAEFRRRGGSLAIMAGNHDTWLCPLYERQLGAGSSPSRTMRPFTVFASGWFTAISWVRGAAGSRGWNRARSSRASAACPVRSPKHSTMRSSGTTSASSRPTRNATCASIASTWPHRQAASISW